MSTEITGKRLSEEEFRAVMRAQVRRDGAGPYPYWDTGQAESIFVDEGESVRDAMRDHPSPVMAYVGTVGEEFEYATCSDAPLEAGFCYANARQMAKEMNEDGWRYCEGWAKSIIRGDMVRHAWCVDSDGWVIEVTWDDVSTLYVGVVFDRIPKKRQKNIAISDTWALKQLAKINKRAGR